MFALQGTLLWYTGRSQLLRWLISSPGAGWSTTRAGCLSVLLGLVGSGCGYHRLCGVPVDILTLTWICPLTLCALWGKRTRPLHNPQLKSRDLSLCPQTSAALTPHQGNVSATETMAENHRWSMKLWLAPSSQELCLRMVRAPRGGDSLGVSALVHVDPAGTNLFHKGCFW